MNKIASIGLVILMSTQCLYKLGVITYFYVNRDYIAEVLCVNKVKPIKMCNGQCYLMKHLALADRHDSHDGPIPDRTQRIDFPVFLVSEQVHTVATTAGTGEPNFHYVFLISSKHSSVPFQPPAGPGKLS